MKVREVGKKLYLSFDPNDLYKVDESFELLFWYSKLKQYKKTFKADKNGFTRVSSQVFKKDLGADRKKVWRYNKKLEEKGLIVVDRVARGGRTWIGYKLI